MKQTRSLAWAVDALREQGLGYPETTEDFPWGHRALKVKGKAFAFLALEDEVLSMSFKLPYSAGPARKHSFAAPTGYGLGKSGWITATFSPKDDIPLDLLREWLLESYYAIAPKKVSDRLTEGSAQPKAAPAPKPKTVARKPAAKAAKPAAKVVKPASAPARKRPRG